MSSVNKPEGTSTAARQAVRRMLDPYIGELENEAATTRRVLERVPADKLTWKPHPKSMSLGQLALHIATTPGGVAQILSTDIYESQGFNQPEAKSASELIPALEESVRKAREALSTWSDENATAIWKVIRNGKEILAVPRIGAIRTIMLNHWYHHRGQLAVYLRLLNIPVPSIYGPSADEDPFK
jgi:uncharacterized damage-inducible protein DinB